MIAKATAAAIWGCYREMETGEQLIEEMAKERERMQVDVHTPVLADAFGNVRNLQLGFPMGSNSQRLLGVSPVLAESVIRAHIADKRAELARLNEKARLELAGEAGQDG